MQSPEKRSELQTLPRCVAADRVVSVAPSSDAVNAVVLELAGGATRPVARSWLARHCPDARDPQFLIGGYYVEYGDGYTSWSPADAFEAGYTPDDGRVAPSVSGAYPILAFFKCSHLPERLQIVAQPFCELAESLARGPAGAETAAALRKLLEAKDCAVRAALIP